MRKCCVDKEMRIAENGGNQADLTPHLFIISRQNRNNESARGG
jgi:hypothetical protein